MTDKLCNVAVAVPLRTTFTYKISPRLAAEIQVGSRVLVPPGPPRPDKRARLGVQGSLVT